MEKYYTKQEGNSITLYQIRKGDDMNKKIFVGSKEDTKELILLLQQSIKNYKFKLLPEID